MTEEVTENKDPSLHRLLFDAAWRGCKVWRSPDGSLYADISVGQSHKTVPIEAKGLFIAWLRAVFTNLTKGSIARIKMLEEVVAEFQARALMADNVVTPHLRIAGDDNVIYVDQGGDRPSYVKITPQGWTLERESPYRFVRNKGYLALPDPVAGPPLPSVLGEFIPCKNAEDMAMVVAWLVGAMKPEGPYPILTVSGEQGSTKSTALRVLKRILDPGARELRTPPENERDYVAAIKNTYVVGFDNVSVIKHWFSDAMCRVATGTSAVGGRKLYTDDDEASFTACRPQMVNGIPDFVERGDFIDRCIHINLVQPKEYLDDDTFWRKFNAALPTILGGLYDAASRALRDQAAVVLDYKPRMINFAKWIAAAEPAMDFPKGFILKAYKGNRAVATDKMMEFTPLALAIYAFLEKEMCYHGTYQELYARLATWTEPKNMPKSAYGLAVELRRLGPALRESGVDFRINGRTSKGSEKGRTSIELRRLTPPELPTGENQEVR
jgi:hypothetical protein